ncbi:alpha/beta hydrolase [Streptomyces pinistramenti]|uniref:alpha/beta hydrolase n=1 Tax=Streptomyces pinistramenti TaxID=2884812 RepID=UPI001D06A2BE|nr:alpha/beta hydrolase [Streptomyces pinistramenti]MCB5909586.1 alpha/beta hydrolase [Streptomyces pinistramenti]
MAQQALPERDARLGKPLGLSGDEGARTALRWKGGGRVPGRAVSGVALLLPGGEASGVRRPSPVPALAVRPLAAKLAKVGRPEGLAAHVVHYRCRGWNGAAAHPAEDAAWAVAEVVRRYGDVPVCLVGTGMGARAALHAAGHPAVNSVLGIAPWLPEPGDEPGDLEPVKQLVGRHVLLVHGTNDERTDPDLSYRFAERAKKINRDTCRFEVHSDGHSLFQHRAEVHALAADFMLGSLFARDFARPVKDALAAPPPLGLRMPLASGFGKSLRH